MKGNLIYGQSGGPSSVINASAYGVIKEALQHQDMIEEVYVMKHGISGIMKEELINASKFIDQLELLPKTPASAFGSVRYKLPHHMIDAKPYEKILHIFKKYNIRYFLYNGGNDSMDTCLKIDEYMKYIGYEINVIGVPKTIDNDLPFTDHTPGFGSAAKYIINTIMQINFDSIVYPVGKVTIVEIMGRHAGWLTASSYVANEFGAGPDLVYIPEVPLNYKRFVREVKEVYSKKQQCLIAVSEGIKDEYGKFLGSIAAQNDAFGHKQLGGVAMILGEVIKEELGYSYRAIELSSTQRAASFIRSQSDVEEAIEVGKAAVRFAIDGESGKMITINRISNDPYQVEYGVHDVAEIANQELIIPEHMYDLEKNGMTEAFFDYIFPLIEGEYEQTYKRGVQQFFNIKQIKPE